MLDGATWGWCLDKRGGVGDWLASMRAGVARAVELSGLVAELAGPLGFWFLDGRGGDGGTVAVARRDGGKALEFFGAGTAQLC